MKRYLRILLPVLTLLCLALIFLNSVQKTASLKKNEETVAGVLEQVAEEITQNSVSIRPSGKAVISKLAHVLEYTVFSVLFTASVLVLHGEREHLFFSLMFACSFVAITDEHLQTLNVNRTSRVSDIMIDLAACFLGYALVCLFYRWSERRKHRARTSSDS